ncbi:MAG TPA: glycosyltransferase family 1 protein [Pyrinomonadaceae bacterium]|jgi:glycosyltransferase involved in cell wall biosynthesis|nr:glycosyltransferase family 1 protein [Pyrinomonadaceae bacterium]
MRILIDGQTLRTPEINRGIGVYFKKTVEGILASDLTNDFFIIGTPPDELTHFSPWFRQQLHCVAPDAHEFTKASDERSNQAYSDLINETISREQIDIYWSPNPLMLNVFLPANGNSGCCFAATIFDLIPAAMENHFRKHWPSQTLRQYKERLRLLERDYDLFLHISQYTQSDVRRMLRVDGKRHVVTPLAADEFFRPYPFPKIPVERDYILYPGGFDPRKNMDRALQAFAAMKRKYSGEPGVAETDLVIVCHKEAASESEMLKRASRLGIADHLRLTGFVSNAELVALYQKARCLFFPSLYEGFGLPVLEGLACGLPVAASNCSSIPEVAGSLACYFDPLDVESMSGALYAAFNAPVDFESRRRRYDYAKQFSWQRTALATLQAFSDSNHAPRPAPVAATASL